MIGSSKTATTTQLSAKSSPDESDSFSSFQSEIPGEVGVAFAPLGSQVIQDYGGTAVDHAWSSFKVPIVVTDRRIVWIDTQYDKGGGFSGFGVAGLALPHLDRLVIETCSLSKERLADADTILGFAAEGAALYDADPIKLTGYQYCSQAVATRA